MKKYAIGIDVGGTKVAAGLMDQAGELLATYKTTAHSEREPGYVIEAIEQSCQALLDQSGIAKEEVQGIGLGFAGTVNGPAGVVLISSNLPAWNHMPLRDTLAKSLGMPVVMENDANVAALAELRYGAGQGVKNMCYVCFSTGYGMGIVINGQIYSGHTGTAGELSHVVVDVHGPDCTCGKKGCLMAYASGIGISRAIYERIERGEDTLLKQDATPDRRRIKGEAVLKAVQAGDRLAGEVLHTAGYYFGLGLSIVVQIINPELIVIGGGLTKMGDALMQPVMQGYRETVQPELQDSVKFKPCALCDQVGVVGAASLVFVEENK
ncbi:MAG: ROK family protein [Chloroflexi bacterium]|nr:ROK family protein [Anaerolineaceae bacterium]NMB87847.1 ROK family protein [Chloroflexota bacterium]